MVDTGNKVDSAALRGLELQALSDSLDSIERELGPTDDLNVTNNANSAKNQSVNPRRTPVPPPARASGFKRNRPDSPDNNNLERPQKRPAPRIPSHLEADFRKIRNYRDKAVRFGLRANTLAKYLRDGIIPKGLLISLKPTIGAADAGFVAQWEQTLKHCSNTLISITSEQCLLYQTKFEEAANTAITELKSKATEAEVENLLDFVAELIDRKKTTLSRSKERKLEADRTGSRSNKGRELSNKETKQKTALKWRRSQNRRQQGKKQTELSDILATLLTSVTKALK